ncbi:MAG: 3-dehydroquinate synthase [Bacteroidales bacterium]|nr:3-dehydroquinate synthase [Bacteroidales bacterium]MCL2738739.1 3-dehydroquinate synthase [Bacteroidales bacterium]
MNQPFIIAGPCSAESPEQLQDAARALKQIGIDFFRAGVWKPRSHPCDFEGHGVKALDWLAQIQQLFQLPVATEVASTEHVEAVLKAGLKGVWIGARTTVNPFAVQELASALSGTGLKIFVKNPVNPDTGLWLGALERLYKAGLNDLAAVHRGFSVYGPGGYRNAPIWLVPFELKRQMPDIPLLCDPSHIAGDRLLVGAIAQKAMDLAFDGLMIEVHPHPQEALSDAGQQLSTAAFSALMEGLTLRQSNTSDHQLNSRLEGLRAQIDLADDQIVELLAQRMQVVQEIGALKREGGLTILQRRRWDALLARIKERGRGLNLSPDFLERLFGLIHQEAIHHQHEFLPAEADGATTVSTLFPAPTPAAVCTVPRMGSIDELSDLLRGKQAVLLVDKNVEELYRHRLPDFPTITVEAGEDLKNMSTVEALMKRLVALQADRSSLIVGMGGGIVCDIAGLVASIYMRGVSFALAPTTLLAQADAAIGGKNGVNVDRLKNMAGCVNQPAWILCDPTLLKTLPEQQIRSGLAEVVKHALIGDPCLLDYLERHAQAIMALEPTPLHDVLRASHRFKCSVVNRDEREHGLRRILNFGHTVGHGIEAASDTYTHGEAVAVGMLFAVALSTKYTGFGAELLPRLKALYAVFGLPTSLPCSLEELSKVLCSDKKKEGNEIRLILLKATGRPYPQKIPIKVLAAELPWAHNVLVS